MLHKSDEPMIKSEPPVDSGSPTRSVHVASANGNAFPPEGQTHHRWLPVAVCLFLAAVIWAVFGQTLHYEFINYDDPTCVYNNRVITQGLTWHGTVWMFTHEDEHEWFPVTCVSRMLDWQLYGSNAGGHHLTNVLLHAATAILLFLVLRKMTGAFWRAAFVAAVFAIHPLRVESVAWVVERKDVLSGLFFMLTLLAWAQFAQEQGVAQKATESGKGGIFSFLPSPFSAFYWLALVFFALGLLSKSMLVTLPFILLLLDFWPLKRLPAGGSCAAHPGFHTWLGLILEKIPFLLLSAGSCLTTILTEKNVMLTAHDSTPLFWRIGNALLAYTDYLRHMVYPVGLAVVYPHSETNPSIGSVGFSALILFAISAGVMAGRRKHPYLLVGWLWYLGMFLPVIDSMQSTQNARADRYTYLPQIGLYILMAWGAVELSNSWRHRRAMLGFAAAAILASLSAAAYVQTSYWKNSVSLWTHTLACTSENSFADNSLGSALATQGKWDEAIPHFERALQLKPNYADAHYNLGDALATQGKWDEAIPHFERALQLKPDYADAHYDLGLTLAAQGKWDEAIQHYEQVFHLKLDYADAQYISGVGLAAQGKWDEAIELYKRVLQVKPDNAEAHNNLGVALASQGKLTEAIQHFQRALTLATVQGNTALAESIRTRLKSYKSALPQAQIP
jgi:tetratricopeptide (TPR) repeat protein